MIRNMKRKTFLNRGKYMALVAYALMVGAGILASCADKDDNVLTGQPDWLGNSIYERLQEEGNYTILLQLIDDMGQKEVLSRTGSKTLFAADDNAFGKWFGHNEWRVNSYDELTNTQKRLLVNNAMVNNAYLIELLSNISGNPPLKGQCMRRMTASDYNDSIPVMLPSAMPQSQPWDRVRSHSEGIRIYQDASSAPMIHFLPAFMVQNHITDNDLRILTNGVSNSISDPWVDGMKITESDITCKNGYIHKVDGVIESAPNMFEIMNRHENMSKWRDLVNRFSLPWHIGSYQVMEASRQLTIDSVYERRFFSELNRTTRFDAEHNTIPLEQTQDGSYTSIGYLKFDPGWNGYYNIGSNEVSGISTDAAAMFVPTNDAVDYWWEHDGKPLQEKYGTWDAIPADVLAALVNVNMLTSFVNNVPSKFGTVLDDAKMELGIKEEHVDSCFMGCNGVVYLTNRVFTPRLYSSVSFPALIHKDIMGIIYWAIENCDFSAYLNSMDSRYSLFVPTNASMLGYIDPVTYGENPFHVYMFKYDESKPKINRVQADLYEATIDPVTGAIVLGTSLGTVANSTQIRNRLTDLMDQLIVVGDVEDGKTYYKTKGGSVIKVDHAGQADMTVSGGLQMENNSSISVERIYDMTKGGNGKTYVLNGIPSGASKSVYNVLGEHPEFTAFLNLLNGNDEDSVENNLLMNSQNNYYCPNNTSNKNIRLFEKYNYTVYVPEKDSIQYLIDNKFLPTWDDYDAQTIEVWGEGNDAKMKKARAAIRRRILNFVRYHIQDRSVYIGGETVTDTRFESSKLNTNNNRFYTLLVNADENSLDVTDQRNVKHEVDTSNGLYNITCREYWLTAKDGNNRRIASASDAVVHAIKGVLLYDNSLTSKTWVEELDDIKNE